MLRSIPYLTFSEEKSAEGDSGVIFHLPERTYQGYNFYSSRTVSTAFLLDMAGKIRHRWNFPPALKARANAKYAFLLSNGDIMVIRPGRELIRLDWDSQVLWKKRIPAHHDVAQAPDGTFYVLFTEKEKYRDLRVNFCGIAHMTSEGEDIDRWVSFEHLAEIQDALDTRSFLDGILDSIEAGWTPEGHELDEIEAATEPGRYHYDYFHMNTVDILAPSDIEEIDPRFQRGNLLVCFRNVNQIAVLEKDTYRILWAWGEGELEWPHHPTLLENGHILIFDNGVKRQHSRIVELDPVSEKIVWEYAPGSPEEFYSYGRGSAQRLPNGNTLICESDRGRAFEVDQAGETVWVWRNPTREWARPEGVYRMIRYPADLVEKLLHRTEHQVPAAPE
ncbi:arylsulfotransferase family protein [Candidatus Zixiibacteriota bacterium]